MAVSPTIPMHGEALAREVAALWRKAEKSFQPDASSPAIVLENRRRRAQQRIEDALASRGTEEVPARLKAEVLELMGQWAARAYEDAFAAVQEFENRCARDRDLVLAEASGDEKRLLDVLERNYRQKVIEQFGEIELRGVQVGHRVRLDLNDVYVPLHLEAVPSSESPVEQLLLSRRTPVLDVLVKHKRITIVGSPGSGKSTLVQALATSYARAADGPLPLVLVARELGGVKLPPDFKVDPRVVEREKRVIVFVDGLDEAPHEGRERLLRWIESFASSHPEATVVVTSRPTGSPGEAERCIAGFEPYRLAELTQEEVGQFINKWCLAAEQSAQRDPAKASADAMKAAEDLKSRIARTRAVQRIAVNPLLTTILCIVHRFLGRTIPEHRVTLYQKCTDALLYEWDRAKFADGSAIGLLDADQKRRLLRGIASRMHESHEAEVSAREVILHFQEVLPELGRPDDDAAAIVQEIRDRSGLLVERREGFFAFSHLTFQEYLAALDFVARRRVDDLVDHWKDPWWQEVIALAAGTPGCDAGQLISQLLTHKVDGATFLAAACLETAVDVPPRVRHRVEIAISKLVPPRDFFRAERLASVGTVVIPALLEALPTAAAVERGYILWSLGSLRYDPLVPLISQYTSDRSVSFQDFLVGDLAMFTLIRHAAASQTAVEAVTRGLQLEWPIESLQGMQAEARRLDSAEIRRLLLAEIRKAINRGSGVKSSTRTASKPRSKPSPAKKSGRTGDGSASGRAKASQRKPRASR